MKFHVCKCNGSHTEGNNPNFAGAVMDSELAPLSFSNKLLELATFVETSAQLSLVVKNRTEC